MRRIVLREPANLREGAGFLSGVSHRTSTRLYQPLVSSQFYGEASVKLSESPRPFLKVENGVLFNVLFAPSR